MAAGQIPAALPPAQSQQSTAPGTVPAIPQVAQTEQKAVIPDAPGLTTSVWDWKGLRVEKIEFEGVTFDESDTLPKELAQKAGMPLDPEQVRASLRRLFASGRYRDISVRGVRQGDTVTLIFAGVVRYYVGRVTILGVKSERLASLLEFATKLSPGAAFNESQIATGTQGIKDILAQQGYYEAAVKPDSQTDEAGSQVNVTYTVTVGPQAKVGQITLTGTDPGLTLEEFRKKSKLKEGSRVSRDTASNAMDRLRKQYQKNDRLEATVTLQKETYAESRKQVDYDYITAGTSGPQVKVSVEGAKISKSRLHLLVPIYQEGTIDNDLLNEGVLLIFEIMSSSRS